MKYLEIIPDFLSMYGVFTSQNTSQIRQEMSINASICALIYLHAILLYFVFACCEVRGNNRSPELEMMNYG